MGPCVLTEDTEAQETSLLPLPERNLVRRRDPQAAGRGRVLFSAEGVPQPSSDFGLLFFRGPLLALLLYVYKLSLTSVSGGAAWHPGRVTRRCSSGIELGREEPGNGR